MVDPTPPTHLQRLGAARDRLTALLESEEDAAKAARLAQELRAHHAEIAVLEKAQPEKKGTALDELAERRKSAGRPDASRKSGSSR